MIWQNLQTLVSQQPIFVGADADIIKKGLFEGIDPVNGGLNAIDALIHNAVVLALFLAGTLSVIFIVVAGLKYVLSAGNPSGTKSAKDTLLYAVIGLIVTMSAWAILYFATSII